MLHLTLGTKPNIPASAATGVTAECECHSGMVPSHGRGRDGVSERQAKKAGGATTAGAEAGWDDACRLTRRSVRHRRAAIGAPVARAGRR
ncbi:hypothetical protein VTN00DRAFT_1477 [Thermoascus crustaceus]|uniref:uncharacterized protein n=1 Tax=Thermoascus crustaceus TaxID=5088 RepID=UPI00374221BF